MRSSVWEGRRGNKWRKSYFFSWGGGGGGIRKRKKKKEGEKYKKKAGGKKRKEGVGRVNAHPRGGAGKEKNK